MNDTSGFFFVLTILLLVFLLDGDPDLWDKLYQIAHMEADHYLYTH
jgi:hypothetical protein